MSRRPSALARTLGVLAIAVASTASAAFAADSPAGGPAITSVDTSEYPAVGLTVVADDPITDTDTVSVTQDGESRPVTSVDQIEGPFSVALVVDASAAMEDQLRAVVVAATELALRLPGDTEIALVTAGGEARVTTPPTRDTGEVIAALAELEPGGEPVVLDAVGLALDELSAEPDRHGVVVVLTAGADPASDAEVGEFAEQLRARDAPLFAVVLEAGALDDVTAAAGGRVERVSEAERISDGLRGVAGDLGNLYRVEFTAEEVSGRTEIGMALGDGRSAIVTVTQPLADAPDSTEGSPAAELPADAQSAGEPGATADPGSSMPVGVMVWAVVLVLGLGTLLLRRAMGRRSSAGATAGTGAGSARAADEGPGGESGTEVEVEAAASGAAERGDAAGGDVAAAGQGPAGATPPAAWSPEASSEEDGALPAEVPAPFVHAPAPDYSPRTGKETAPADESPIEDLRAEAGGERAPVASTTFRAPSPTASVNEDSATDEPRAGEHEDEASVGEVGEEDRARPFTPPVAESTADVDEGDDVAIEADLRQAVHVEAVEGSEHFERWRETGRGVGATGQSALDGTEFGGSAPAPSRYAPDPGAREPPPPASGRWERAPAASEDEAAASPATEPPVSGSDASEPPASSPGVIAQQSSEPATPGPPSEWETPVSESPAPGPPSSEPPASDSPEWVASNAPTAGSPQSGPPPPPQSVAGPTGDALTGTDLPASAVAPDSAAPGPEASEPPPPREATEIEPDRAAVPSLERGLIGATLQHVWSVDPDLRQSAENLLGRQITSVLRRGHHTLVGFAGTDLVLHTRTGLGGEWQLLRQGERPGEEMRWVRLLLETEEWTAVCTATRVSELLTTSQVAADSELAPPS